MESDITPIQDWAADDLQQAIDDNNDDARDLALNGDSTNDSSN